MPGLIYSIQLHLASHRHFDLRLQAGSVLKSWAIPKEPPKGMEKRLAVQTEDHDLDYWNFEGRIDEGAYGAGEVSVWDSGTYDVIDRKPYKWVIEISGKKLKGKFVLIKLKREDPKDRNWLFFKKKDD